MRMSRMHFQLIASVIRDSGLAFTDRVSLTERFTAELALTNPHFDRERFTRAALPELYPPER